MPARCGETSDLPVAVEPREDALSVGAEQDDVVRLGRHTFDFHPGRPNGHARDGKADRPWLFRQKALDGGCGNVPLDDVARDFAGVAGREIEGTPSRIFTRLISASRSPRPGNPPA